MGEPKRALRNLKEAVRLYLEEAEKKGALDRILEALEKQRASLDDPAEFVKRDMAFHTAIASVSGNSVCLLLNEAMLDWLFDFRRDLLRLPGSEFITLAEHQRLLDAIARHDADEAERAMMDHLTRANERYRILEDAMARRSLAGGPGET